MSLSALIAEAGGTIHSLEVTADVTLGEDKEAGGFKLTGIKLTVRGEVEGLDEAGFKDAAEKAKAGCPISKAPRRASRSAHAASRTPAPRRARTLGLRNGSRWSPSSGTAPVQEVVLDDGVDALVAGVVRRVAVAVALDEHARVELAGSASAHFSGVAGSRLVPSTRIGAAPSPRMSAAPRSTSPRCRGTPVIAQAKIRPKVGEASSKAGKSDGTFVERDRRRVVEAVDRVVGLDRVVGVGPVGVARGVGVGELHQRRALALERGGERGAQQEPVVAVVERRDDAVERVADRRARGRPPAAAAPRSSRAGR